VDRYEDIAHRPSHLSLKAPFTARLQGFSYHDGALAILKVWKDHLSHSQPATDVIKHTRRGLIKPALMRNLALLEWMLEGAFFGEHGLELEYDCIVVQTASIRQRLATLLKKTGPQRISHELTSTTAEELNKEARDIDKVLQDWIALPKQGVSPATPPVKPPSAHERFLFPNSPQLLKSRIRSRLESILRYRDACQ
jgi:hypothetical protein